MSSIDAQIAKTLAQELRRLENIIRNNLVKGGISATGTTQSLLNYGVNGSYGYLVGAAWMSTLETGRGPAKGGGTGGDFIERLKRWILAKGLQYEGANDLDRLARFFHWYINKYGSKMFRLKQTRDVYSSAIDQFEVRVVTALADVALAEVEKLV